MATTIEDLEQLQNQLNQLDRKTGIFKGQARNGKVKKHLLHMKQDLESACEDLQEAIQEEGE